MQDSDGSAINFDHQSIMKSLRGEVVILLLVVVLWWWWCGVCGCGRGGTGAGVVAVALIWCCGCVSG